MLSRTGALFVLFLAVTLLPSSPRALVIADVLPIHHTHDMEIVDGLAYLVGSSFPDGPPTLRILDLSDPAAPVEVGSFYTPYGARDVEVVGGRAYLAGWGEVRIVDVSDPAQPVEIGSFSAQCDAADVEVVGNYAYLVDQPLSTHSLLCRVSLVSKLRVIDVSNPAAPTQVSETDLDFHVDLEAVEGVVYLTDSDDLELIDVSNPAAPITVGVVPDVWARDIDVADGYVYAVSDGYELEVIDVKDPANPFTVGRAVAGGYSSSIDVVDGLAYLGGHGLKVVDVSNPAAPKRRGSIYVPYSGVLGAYDGYAYLAGGEGLNIVDLSLLDTPTEVGWAEVVGSVGDVEVPNDIEVSDGVAYLAAGEDDYFNYSRPPGEGGLRTYDITDPTAPAALGGIDTADIALDVELAAGLAFVAAGADGLRIFDVTNPSVPAAAGALALPGFTAKLEVVGTTAYVVDRGTRTRHNGTKTNRALRVIDISNAAAPAVLGVVEFTNLRNGRCRIPGIAVVEQYAYVACDGLLVVDVSNPAQPALILLGGRLGGGSDSSIQVAGDRAYISNGSGSSGSLFAYDISDPARPVRIYEAFSAGTRAIVVEDGFVYSAGYYGGLSVHDLAGSLPAVFLGGYPPDRGGWNGLAISDGLVFGVTNRGYLQVVDLGAEYKHSRAVEIAIRAEREPAVVNLASRGVIGVAVLGAADFDVARIDRSTLRFGPSSAAPAHKAGGHLEDVNGDGNPDLLSHYRIPDTGFSEADKSACVSGETSDATPILGCGAIGAILPRGQPKASGVAN